MDRKSPFRLLSVWAWCTHSRMTDKRHLQSQFSPTPPQFSLHTDKARTMVLVRVSTVVNIAYRKCSEWTQLATGFIQEEKEKHWQFYLYVHLRVDKFFQILNGSHQERATIGEHLSMLECKRWGNKWDLPFLLTSSCLIAFPPPKNKARSKPLFVALCIRVPPLTPWSPSCAIDRNHRISPIIVILFRTLSMPGQKRLWLDTIFQEPQDL